MLTLTVGATTIKRYEIFKDRKNTSKESEVGI